MPKNETTCFAVIYIPFYALQCARQKCAFENNVPWKKGREDQLSLGGVEEERIGLCKTRII